jgi:cytochrome c biogenesis protein CcmG, thiol:disulfide interchange protein DsbE
VAGLIVTLPLLGVLFLNLGRDPRALDSPLVGRPAPAFSLTPLGGGPPVALASLRGAPVVVNFWASWCEPCVTEHAALLEGARRWGGRVHFVGVVYEDTEADALAFLEARGRAYVSLLDPGGRTAIAYGIGGVPETYFVDAAGQVVAKHVGPVTPRVLESRLQQAGLR